MPEVAAILLQFASLSGVLTVADDVGKLSSEALMGICDRYWLPSTESYVRFVTAYNELARRGPEIRDWCRRHLAHPDYQAREVAAYLLGQLGKRRLLGETEEAIVAELGANTRRPIEEDGKELQAVDAAIGALGEIGDRSGIPYLRDVLFSNDEWLDGDCQWSAAEALGRLVGEPFMQLPEPVESARTWLSARPSTDTDDL